MKLAKIEIDGQVHYAEVEGQTCRLIDGDQAVVNSYEYDAFGTVTAETEGIANDHQFHGEAQEDETGLVFLRARYMDAETGRFFTRDPWAGAQDDPPTLNTYTFPSNDPTNLRDPDGRGAFWERFGRGLERFNRRARSISEWMDEAENTMIEGLSCTPGSIGDFFTLLGGAKRAAESASERFRTWLFKGWDAGRPGGVALNKSANVLLDINQIAGGTYDADTGQIILYGKEDGSATALPPMDLDDLAVAFSAVNQGTMPVVSIEDPVVSSPPEWPGRECLDDQTVAR